MIAKPKLKVAICFHCLEPFDPTEAKVCPICNTLVCPSCGYCYCQLTKRAKKAFLARVASVPVDEDERDWALEKLVELKGGSHA